MKHRSLPLMLGIRNGMGLAICLFLPTIMIAQLDRTRPPAPAPPPEVELAQYESFTLGNGMRVIVVENHKLPLVGVQVRFDIPPVVQAEKAGYIEVFGDMLATGTGLRTKVQLDEQIDRLGAHLVTTSDGVYASGLKKNLPAMLDIVQDVVTNSTFPDQELQRVLTRYRSAVQQRKDDPDAIAEAVGRSVTFSRTHPYGEVMSLKSLDNIGREHINAYYRRFFRPEAGYLVFVGDITIKEAKELSRKHFNGWKVPMEATVNDDGTEEVPGLGSIQFLQRPLGPSGQRRVAMVDRPGAAQSVIRVSYPLNLHPRDIRSMSAQVMNTILGGGVFNARLMQNLRETNAFTYGAYSSLDIDRFNGSFTVSVSVRTEVTDSAITEIMNELLRMRSAPVTAAELELAKNYMAGSFARGLEDPRTVARFALNTYLNDLPKDHYATYLKRLEAVTARDVEEAAQAFLHPDHAIIFVVGDKEKVQHKLPALAADPNARLLLLDENGEMYREELTPAPDKTVRGVIEAYLSAIGGRSKVEEIGTLHTRMGTQLGGMSISIQQWYGPGGRFRSETTAGDMGVLQEVVLDGERAVSRSPQGAQEIMSPDLEDVMANAHPIPELRIDELAERMVLSGRTRVNEEDAYKITITTRNGTTIHDYYSVASGLKLRRVDQKMLQGRPVTITTDYGDYKEVAGVKFAHQIKEGGGPMGEMMITVEHIEVDPDLPPGFFSTGLPPVDPDDEDQ